MATRRPRRVSRVAERPPAKERLLLDTHIWLWWQSDDPRLDGKTRRAISEADEVCFSIASAWEIAIKASLGKLRLPKSADIGAELMKDGFTLLGVGLEHTRTLITIPQHHRDPFDRMLVAQAIVEDLVIVSADRSFDRYDVRRLNAAAVP